MTKTHQAAYRRRTPSKTTAPKHICTRRSPVCKVMYFVCTAPTPPRVHAACEQLALLPAWLSTSPGLHAVPPEHHPEPCDRTAHKVSCTRKLFMQHRHISFSTLLCPYKMSWGWPGTPARSRRRPRRFMFLSPNGHASSLKQLRGRWPLDPAYATKLRSRCRRCPC